MGNLTSDIAIKYLPSGIAVAEGSLAVNRKRKGRDGKPIEETLFVDIKFYGKTAEVANQYTRKGSNIHIEGRLVQDRWQDKQTGKGRSKLYIAVDNLQLLGKSENSQAQGGYSNNPPQPQPQMQQQQQQARPQPQMQQQQQQQVRPQVNPNQQFEPQPLIQKHGEVDIDDQEIPF
jgi:single-strand DNA-binding protein